jgi:hypothetical protein
MGHDLSRLLAAGFVKEV